jgi:two-component system, NarL family, response regulator
MSAGIRILVVDDHPMVREGLAAMLESSAGMTVVGMAAGGEEAVKLFIEQRPDVVLVDLRMPVVDGIETLRRLRKLDPEARVLILSSFDFAEDVQRAVEAGARGYLLKDAPREELERAIHSVHAGGRVFPAEVANG